MNKICVIGVYFGSLPKYFSLWVKSCAMNPTVDFKVFSDQQFADLPENVRIYPMTLPEMKARAEKVMGFPVSLDKPYKCCDFKIAYGLIFADYVTQYDYWGHCDFDLIFGDLQKFFDEYDLYSYDRFLALGHLSLYRNTEEVNHRFQCAGSDCDYKTVYTSELFYAFDEIPGLTAIYLKNGFSMFKDRIFVDIASVYHRYRIIDKYSLDKKAENYKYQVFYWENGTTYRAYMKKGQLYKEEYIYVHFKKRPNFTVDFNVQSTDAFYITNQGFFQKTGEVTMRDIKRFNPYPGWLYEKAERVRFDLRQKISRVPAAVRKVLNKNGCW